MVRWMILTGGVAVCLAATLCAPRAWAADGEPTEELKFDLPEPFFGGTPFDYWAENLEKEDFTDRPPFLAPKGITVISRGKPVTASSAPLSGDLKMITDGDKRYDEGSLVTLGPGVQWVQVDLGAPHELYAILLWHFHKGKTVYFSVVVQACDTPDFKEDVTFLYNSDLENHAGFGSGQDYRYVENNKGRLFDPKGHKARYLRFYSDGNSWNENNHYVEIEVWGRPVRASESETNLRPEKRDAEAMEELTFGALKCILRIKPSNEEMQVEQVYEMRGSPPCMAPKGTSLVSAARPVTASSVPESGDLKMITDGETNNADGLVSFRRELNWIQMDLGATHELYAILLWHRRTGNLSSFPLSVQFSNDPSFKDRVNFLGNNPQNTLSDSQEGVGCYVVGFCEVRLFAPGGREARFVRFHVPGSDWRQRNEYAEIEVWGRPVKECGQREGAEPGAENEEALEELKFELPEPFFGGLPF